MNWINHYREIRTTASDAVKVVENGSHVFLSGNAATPSTMIQALAEHALNLKDVEIYYAHLLGANPLALPEFQGHVRLNTLFVGASDRRAVNEGLVNHIPIHLHQIPSLFRRKLIPIDVAIIHTSPPDEHGFLSYGVECLATKAAAETAKFVIAQVNSKMPRTLGDSFIHISRISRVVEVDEPLPTLPKGEVKDVERQIASHIAELIEDGSTLQLGIGGIPDAVLRLLVSFKDIGIHTEMISDGVMELIEAGVITGMKKSIHPGKVVATFIYGSQLLYDYVNNNPVFEIHPGEYTNDPFIIARNDRMIAVNSALEVDLTGQVCSDSLGTQIYSGFGGQVDFIRGAAHAKNGKPIIALPSTAMHGTVSRIVPVLKTGAGVVTTRADVHYVVTEFGSAYLFGKNLYQRARALINIAHPDFQEELEKAAQERGYFR